MPKIDYGYVHQFVWDNDEKTRAAHLKPDLALRTLRTLPKIAANIKTALDVGCGPGRLVQALRAQGVLAHGLDVIMPERTGHARWYHQGSILHIPWPDEKFDLVACQDCLEHLSPQFPDDLTPAVHELFRVSKRYVLISVGTTQEPAYVPKPPGVDRIHQIVRPWEWWIGKIKAIMKGIRPKLIHAVYTPHPNLTLWEARWK